MSRDERPETDRGAALITVLTMLAVMATLAIVVVDAANMSVRRTGNMVRMEQTRWYLIGAENFARARLDNLIRRVDSDDIDQDQWQAVPFVFPLDDGAMQTVLRDGSNCFNLNSLVDARDSGVSASSARGMVQFSRLMDIVGVRAGMGELAASLADYIDSDSMPNAGGAEDGPPQGQSGAYRTANTLMADFSELRRVRGFDDETVRALAPYVCVRPSAAPNLINPNTLLPDQAPLLSMAVADLNLETARQIIRDRPRGGWESLDAFFLHPRLSALEINEATRAQFSLRSSYYVLLTRVERDGARESSAALLEAGPGGATIVVRRVFGAGNAENLL